MEIDYTYIIERIIETIKENTPKNNLYSLAIVGSFANSQHKLEMINDIDILYIYDDAIFDGKHARIDRGIYFSILQLNKDIRNEFANDMEIISSYDCGPFKPIIDGKRKIEIHNLIYTVNRWLREEPTFLYDRARLYRLLYGKPPSTIYDVKSFSIYSVIRDLYGIDHCLQMIRSKRIKYCVWEQDPNNINIMKIGVREKDIGESTYENMCRMLELIFYAVIRSTVNSIRIFTQEAHYYREDCKIFMSTFSNFKEKKFLKEILTLKDRYRNGKLRFDNKVVSRLSDNCITYLEELKMLLHMEINKR